MLSAETLRRTLFLLTPWLSRIASLIVVVILVGLMPDIAGIDPSQSNPFCVRGRGNNICLRLKL